MCDPLTIGIIVGVTVAATGTVTAVEQQKAAEQKKKAAKRQFTIEESLANRELVGASEQNAELNYELARQAAEDRGVIQSSGLGERSVRAIGRSIGFQLGQDVATVQKNMDTARTNARTRLALGRQRRDAIYEAAGDTSGKRLGLGIGLSLLQGVGAGGTAFFAAGGTTGGDSVNSDIGLPTDPQTLDPDIATSGGQPYRLA